MSVKNPVMRKVWLSAIVVGSLFALAAFGIRPYWLRGWSRTQPTEPFFPDLGTHSRKITTTSATAQKYFDQGLAFFYGFNYTEAARSFEAAATADPKCAMAYWGIAIANGDAVANPVSDAALAKAAVQALARARELTDSSSPVERDLILALSVRYTDPMPPDPKPLDRAYANAMRKMWQAYPDDGDVGALTGQALMLLHRKGQWTAEGEPKTGTEELIRTLETVLEKHPMHPYALHLLIHAVEGSPHPEKGDTAADRVRKLAPGLGHLTHMPTHIDIRRGRWQEAVTASEKAVAADAIYRQIAHEPGPHYRILMAHNNHMLAYAAAMRGESEKATQAIQHLIADLPADFIAQHPDELDAFFAMPYELHIRFGRWDAMLAEPEPKSSFPIAAAFWHYARGVAYAAKSNTEEAIKERFAFLTARQKVPAGAVFRKNSAEAVFAVADGMLVGEILYREGKVGKAVVKLREAALLEDKLLYVEPPEWILPVRHTLGATLMDARRFAEAEDVYREDLVRRPENGWSLFGLSRSLRAQKKLAEATAVSAQFQTAWNHADFKLTSSCLCLQGKD